MEYTHNHYLSILIYEHCHKTGFPQICPEAEVDLRSFPFSNYEFVLIFKSLTYKFDCSKKCYAMTADLLDYLKRTFKGNYGLFLTAFISVGYPFFYQN